MFFNDLLYHSFILPYIAVEETVLQPNARGEPPHYVRHPHAKSCPWRGRLHCLVGQCLHVVSVSNPSICEYSVVHDYIDFVSQGVGSSERDRVLMEDTLRLNKFENVASSVSFSY